MRLQVSGKAVRMAPAATVAGYHGLINCERRVIVCARGIGHSICEVAIQFGFLRMYSLVYREYPISDKTINLRQW